ncbi:hypothetical protein OGATHE_005251 [Ogataea polymorpha]|uniref:Uncharacterized protein n=1 Tax=Ogataea polymorpha TaxID=460523 RepID=A0A9P8T089_9ASCO|nr:hypothetical protein OGATHE_005251 [Ogataea polymorpha]
MIDIMVRIWEDMHIVIFDSFSVKRIQKLQRVLEMHVIVGRAVHDEESSDLLEFVDIANFRHALVVFIVFGFVHVPLCVNRIVEQPIGHRSNCHTVFESGARVIFQRLQSGEATV